MDRSEQAHRPLLALVGPTGVGKTALGVLLARQLGGEIVSADSRQVYRYMDSGTAKPTPEEQAQARHHLIDIIDPDGDFGLATYQELAYAAIALAQIDAQLFELPAMRERVSKFPADAGHPLSCNQRASIKVDLFSRDRVSSPGG